MTGNSGLPSDTLQFFAHEEGRVRVNTDSVGGQPQTSFKYDYFLKDHLGNTRMVLTDEQQTDKYPAATMEVADSATENLYYSKLAETRFSPLPAGYPTDTATNPNNYVSRVGGAGGSKVGPGITLKVMSGDQFSIRVSSWYRLNGTSPGSPVNPVSDVLANLIAGVGNLPGGAHPSVGVLQANSASLSDNLTQFLSDTAGGTTQGRPMAFVTWVLFDNQFNYVPESSGFQQVGSDQEFKKHQLLNLPVSKSGYLYIYLSNETPNVNVFFDNLQVSHIRGALLEENHYYPFGLVLKGVSDEALKDKYAENKFRFNKGSELQNKEFSDGSGLELYETPLRSLDPQLGRWWQTDAKPTESESVYSSMGNNPILRNDPLGDTSIYPLIFNALVIVSQRSLDMGMNGIRRALTGQGTDLLRQSIVSAGSAETGFLRTRSFGLYSENPASLFGLGADINPDAMNVGSIGGMLPDPAGGGATPDLNFGFADGATSLPSISLKPSLPSHIAYAGKEPNDIGKEGMESAGVTQNTKRIPSATIT